MFPMEFDHRILGTLPFPTDEQTRRITELLRAILGRRIVPYFKTRKGTDPIVLARSQERLTINRLEDEANRNRLVTLLTRTERRLDPPPARADFRLPGLRHPERS